MVIYAFEVAPDTAQPNSYVVTLTCLMISTLGETIDLHFPIATFNSLKLYASILFNNVHQMYVERAYIYLFLNCSSYHHHHIEVVFSVVCEVDKYIFFFVF